MKRKLIMVALALGTVGGFGSGIASMACHSRHRRAHFKSYVTDVCTDAVRKAQKPPSRPHHRHVRPER